MLPLTPLLIILGLAFGSMFAFQQTLLNPQWFSYPLHSFASSTPPESLRHHPGLHFCDRNPFIQNLNRTELALLERTAWAEWDATFLSRITEFIDRKERVYLHNASTDIRYIAPVEVLLPCPTPLKLVGTSSTAGDTAKLLCEPDKLLAVPKCIVYSLGSNNQFEFEEGLLKSLPTCSVYTFDCTSLPPVNYTERLYFEKTCLGDHDFITDEGTVFKSLNSIMTANHHDSVHLLKMDIEGYEFAVFTGLLANPLEPKLPYQISFESHSYNKFPWTMKHMALFNQLITVGYRFVSFEHNILCDHCNEYTIMRVYC